jgi:hypothetical protein
LLALILSFKAPIAGNGAFLFIAAQAIAGRTFRDFFVLEE